MKSGLVHRESRFLIMILSDQLIQQCSKNDRRAHLELYKKCYGYMMSICIRYVNNKDDASALLNQSFLKVITSIEKYDSTQPFKAWMARITVNTIIDEFRKNKKHVYLSIVGHDSEIEEVSLDLHHCEISDRMELDELLSTISELPEREKVVFNLFEVEGYQHIEIAEMLGTSERSSRRLLQKAKQMLRLKIEAKEQFTTNHKYQVYVGQ